MSSAFSVLTPWSLLFPNRFLRAISVSPCLRGAILVLVVASLRHASVVDSVVNPPCSFAFIPFVPCGLLN